MQQFDLRFQNILQSYLELIRYSELILSRQKLN